MKIYLRTSQPIEVIAQRFFGKLQNGGTFYVDLWKEEDAVLAVVQFEGGGILGSMDDLISKDRYIIRSLIERNARLLFGRRDAL